jgi:hypothetical protein
LMLYALGRAVAPQDMPTVRRIVDAAGEHSYAFFDIVQGIVKSEQFRFVQATEQALQTDTTDDSAQQVAGQ